MKGQIQEVIRQKIVDSMTVTVPVFTRRDVHLPRVAGKALAVIGMRRTGKTTFLWQVLAERLDRGTEREGLLYFSFEDERLSGMTTFDLSLVVEEYYRLYPEWRDRRRVVFFLDEIQNVPGWETFTRRLMDNEKVELFLSGSSAKLLSREVASSMRGRAMEALIHPFSFREYLRHAGREPEQPPERLPKAVRSALEKDFRKYLIQGGFPEAQGVDERDRFDLLRGYVDLTLFRDVVERHAVSHPVALRWMVRQLLGNAAGAFSVNRFHRDLKSQGIPVAKDTLHAYLAYLEDAFLVRILSIASHSVRRRMVNPRKVYPVDPGLIPIFSYAGNTNLGHALETCVLLELERRGAELAYIRTPNGYEVDFLARFPNRHEELIQVCIDANDPDTREREVRALTDAAIEHPQADMYLLVLNPHHSHKVPENINVLNVVTWLLQRTT